MRPTLRDQAAEIERRADYWLRCSNEAFGSGDFDLGERCAARATALNARVSDLGEQAAWAEARWPEETSTRQLETQS